MLDKVIKRGRRRMMVEAERFWDTDDNGFVYENRGFNPTEGNVYDVFYKGNLIGTLYEGYTDKAFSSICLRAETFDVERYWKRKDGNTEYVFEGVRLQKKSFISFEEFKKYILRHLDMLIVINIYKTLKR